MGLGYYLFICFHRFLSKHLFSKIPSDSSSYGLLAWILSEIFSSFSNVKPCGSVVVDAPFFTLIFGLFFHYRKPWCFFPPARDELMKQKYPKQRPKTLVPQLRAIVPPVLQRKDQLVQSYDLFFIRFHFGDILPPNFCWRLTIMFEQLS